MANGPNASNAVADVVHVARSTRGAPRSPLGQDLAEEKCDARNHVTLAVSHPEATARMLRLVEPSIADRLVDRFTRLVDGLLAGDPDPTEDE